MDSTSLIQKANDLMDKGDKKMQAWSVFNPSKYDDAAELYEKAANNYKLAKAWKQASDVYKKLAEVYIKLESQHEAATSYVEAAKALTKTPTDDVTEALAIFHKAVEIYTDMGRLNQAAKYLKEIAEQLEKQDSYEASSNMYLQAADLYFTEDSRSEGNKCKLKAAQFQARLGKYIKAVEMFEEVANDFVNNNLLKYSAKGHLMNAGLCKMCYAEVDSLESMIERYKDIDLSFGNSRECQLLVDIVEAMKAGDDQKFQYDISEYDSLSKIDDFKTNILLVIKQRIEAIKQGDEDVEEDSLM